MSENSQPVLEADGIGRSFGGQVVLKAAGIAVRPGRVTALMGRNGVGKSTLFRIVAGTIRADYGTVRFRGKHIAKPALARLARLGLMYSAQASALTRSFTVKSHFQALIQIYGGTDRLEKIQSELRLEELMDRWPHDLSGGERQRVSLGLALVRSPCCLLMDEPFAGVAPVDVPVISKALLELRNQGVGIAISGHDVRDIFSVSDEIIWMIGGTTHWIGTPEEAEVHFQFRREYLGPRVGLTKGGGVRRIK